MKLRDIIADLVFPQKIYCNCCGKYIDETRTYGLCDHCIKSMSFKITYLKDSEREKCFNQAAAAMGYGLYERQLIFGLKYNGSTYLAREIADILFDAITAELREKGESPWLYDDYLVPVPLHKAKLKKRGFNQAEKIGKHLSHRLGIPLCAEGLLRIKATEAQRSLSPEERENNIKDAFRINPKAAGILKNKNILLIDDIYTTGATAVACAKVLLEAGVNRVDFLALASAKNKEHENYACKGSVE